MGVPKKRMSRQKRDQRRAPWKITAPNVSACPTAGARPLGAGDHELRIHHASEVVEMAEHPGQALRKKKDSSIRVCFDLCKAGAAAGMVSAGNSGAVLAGGLFVLGRLDHVDRPCI